MANVAPVGPAEDHIQAENRDAGRVVVLVEHSFKLIVQQSCTFLKTNATGRIEAAALRPKKLVMSIPVNLFPL